MDGQTKKWTAFKIVDILDPRAYAKKKEIQPVAPLVHVLWGRSKQTKEAWIEYFGGES